MNLVVSLFIMVPCSGKEYEIILHNRIGRKGRKAGKIKTRITKSYDYRKIES